VQIEYSRYPPAGIPYSNSSRIRSALGPPLTVGDTLAAPGPRVPVVDSTYVSPVPTIVETWFALGKPQNGRNRALLLLLAESKCKIPTWLSDFKKGRNRCSIGR